MPKKTPDDVKERISALLLDDQNTARDVALLLQQEGVEITEQSVSGIARTLGIVRGRGRKGFQHAQHADWSPNRPHALAARAALPAGSYQELADWILENRGVELSRQQVYNLLSDDT